MNKTAKALLCLALALVLAVLGACAAEEEKEEEALYPITLKGAEVRVGETTVQSLLDQGLHVTWTDENYQAIEVDPETVLEAESYYTGGNVQLGGNAFASISFTTGEEDATLGQAVIARLEFQLAGVEDAQLLEEIAFDGVPVSQWTRELAGEKYPDWTGDDTMWLHYGLTYKYDLNFDMGTGKLVKFAVSKEYDVDWDGEG